MDEPGRYGYRRITALLRAEGWQGNHKRVERLWPQEGAQGGVQPGRGSGRPPPAAVARRRL